MEFSNSLKLKFEFMEGQPATDSEPLLPLRTLCYGRALVAHPLLATSQEGQLRSTESERWYLWNILRDKGRWRRRSSSSSSRRRIAGSLRVNKWIFFSSIGWLLPPSSVTVCRQNEWILGKWMGWWWWWRSEEFPCTRIVNWVVRKIDRNGFGVLNFGWANLLDLFFRFR